MSKKDNKKEIKTNAIRIVESNGIDYKTYTYEAPEGFLDGVTVAEDIGLSEGSVYKTLVVQGHSKNYYVCVIPVAEHLNLKKAAAAFKEKSIQMIPAKDITKITGYIKGGCSPIGMKKLYMTIIDITAQEKETICVSGGKVGVQMELDPKKIASLTEAIFKDII